MDKGGTVVFLDLQKAFDTVNHKILIAKLSTFNFPHDTPKWTESYLNNRTQCVKVNDHQSAALKTHSGVSQGSVLGPLLFSLYINDLPSVCSDMDTQLYADDAVIYAHGSTKQQAAAKLTNALRLTAWLNQSCLQLNTTKIVSVFFSKKQCTTSDIMLLGKKKNAS